MSQATFAAAWAEGAEITIEQAVSVAFRELLAVPQPAEKRQLVWDKNNNGHMTGTPGRPWFSSR